MTNEKLTYYILLGCVVAGSAFSTIAGAYLARPHDLVKKLDEKGRTEYVVNGEYVFEDNGEALGQPIPEESLRPKIHRLNLDNFPNLKPEYNPNQ